MSYEQQFNSIRPFIRGYAKQISRATNIPQEEFESAMCEEFFKKFDEYDGRIPFLAYMKPILQQRARRASKLKTHRFNNMTVGVESDNSDGENILHEFADSQDVLEETVNRIEKSPDKLLLIQALTDRADDITVAAVNLWLVNPNATLNSIATEVGVHHETLKRKFRRLAKNYDKSRFGDISQYLAV